MATNINILASLLAYISLENDCGQQSVLLKAEKDLDQAKNGARKKDVAKRLAGVLSKAFGDTRGPGFAGKDFKALEAALPEALLHAELKEIKAQHFAFIEDEAKQTLELAELEKAEPLKDERGEAARLDVIAKKKGLVAGATALVIENKSEMERLEAEIAAIQATRGGETPKKTGETPEKEKGQMDTKLTIKIGTVTLVPNGPGACSTIGKAAVGAGYIKSYRGRGYEALIAAIQEGYEADKAEKAKEAKALAVESANNFIDLAMEEETLIGRERLAGGTPKERLADMGIDLDETRELIRPLVLAELDLVQNNWVQGDVKKKVSNEVTKVIKVKRDAIRAKCDALQVAALKRRIEICDQVLRANQGTPALKLKSGGRGNKKTAYAHLKDYLRSTRGQNSIREIFTKGPNAALGLSYLSTEAEFKAAYEKGLGSCIEEFRAKLEGFGGRWMTEEEKANRKVEEAAEETVKVEPKPATQAGEGAEVNEGTKPKSTTLADPKPTSVAPLEMMREWYNVAGGDFFKALANYATDPVKAELLAWNPEKGEPTEAARGHVTAILADAEKSAEVMSHMPVPDAQPEPQPEPEAEAEAESNDEKSPEPEPQPESSGEEQDGDEKAEESAGKEEPVSSNDKKAEKAAKKAEKAAKKAVTLATPGGLMAQSARLSNTFSESYRNMGPVMRDAHRRLKDIATAIVTQVEGLEQKDLRLWDEEKVTTNALGAFTKPAGWIASWWKDCQHEAVDSEHLSAADFMQGRLVDAFMESTDTKLAAFTLLLGLQAHVARRAGVENVFFKEGFTYVEEMTEGLSDDAKKRAKAVLESKDPNKAALRLSRDYNAAMRKLLRLEASSAKRVVKGKRPMDLQKDILAVSTLRAAWECINDNRDWAKYTADRGIACEGLRNTVYKDSEGNSHPLFPKSLKEDGPKMLLDALDTVFTKLSPQERHVVFAARFCAAKQLKLAGSPSGFSRGVYFTFDMVRAGLNLMWQPVRWALHIPEVLYKATLGAGIHGIRRALAKDEKKDFITVGEYYGEVWEVCKDFGFRKPKSLLQWLWNGTFGRTDGWEWSDDETKAKKAADRRSLAEVWASMKSHVAPSDADGNMAKTIKAVGRGATNSVDWAAENKVNLGLGVAAAVTTAAVFAPGALIVGAVGVGTTALVVGVRALWRKFRGGESRTTVTVNAQDVQGGVAAAVAAA